MALEKVYGSKGRKDLSFVLVDESASLSAALAERVGAKDRGSLDALIDASITAAFGGEA